MPFNQIPVILSNPILDMGCATCFIVDRQTSPWSVSGSLFNGLSEEKEVVAVAATRDLANITHC